MSTIKRSIILKVVTVFMAIMLSVTSVVANPVGIDAATAVANLSGYNEARIPNTCIVNLAKTKLGCKYVYGKRGPTDFDCSGFVNWVFGQYGIALPTSCSGYAGEKFSNYGKKVSRSELLPGDIVVYGTNVNSLKHVGIYIGDGKMVNAVSPTYGVCITFIDKSAYNSGDKSVLYYSSYPVLYGLRVNAIYQSNHKITHIGVKGNSGTTFPISQAWGSSLNKQSWNVIVFYNDGTYSKILPTSYEVKTSGYKSLIFGTQTITVTYKGFKTKYEVKVK